MEERTVFLALGAAGVVLAALLLELLQHFWVHAVLPLWRRWRYRGVNIAGGWKGLGNASVPVEGEWTEVGLVLEQQLREVRGLLWIRRFAGGSCTEMQVPLAGRVSEGHVTLGPAPEAGAPAPLATALLEVQGRGSSSLNGQLLYRDAQTGAIEGIHVSVHRAASMALPRLRPIAVAHAGAQAAAA
jgi:hypothetical protein